MIPSRSLTHSLTHSLNQSLVHFSYHCCTVPMRRSFQSCSIALSKSRLRLTTAHRHRALTTECTSERVSECMSEGVSENLFIPLHQRSYLRVEGRDTFKFLQGLLTHDVTRSLQGRGDCLACAVLNPKGRIVADLFVYDTSPHTHAHTHSLTHSPSSDSSLNSSDGAGAGAGDENKVRVKTHPHICSVV